MTVGKKIGSGFCLVISLTIVLGWMAIGAMSDGANVSENIADDRVPRMAAYARLQKNIMSMSALSRLYFDTHNQSHLNGVDNNAKNAFEDLGVLEKLNRNVFYENTSRYVENAKKEISSVVALFNSGVKIDSQITTLIKSIIESNKILLDKMSSIISELSSSQRTLLEKEAFINNAIRTDVIGSSSSIIKVVNLYSDMAGILADMAAADRKKDIEALKSIKSKLPLIGNRLDELRPVLSRNQVARDAFLDSEKAWKEFAAKSSELLQIQMDFHALDGQIMGIYSKLQEAVTNELNRSVKEAETVVNNAQVYISKSVTIATYMLAVIIMIGVICSFFLTRSIIKPLSRTQLFAKEIANGHLDRQLEVYGNDEIGALADSLRMMVEALKENMEKAQQESIAASRAKKEGMLAAANALEEIVTTISNASNNLAEQIAQADKSADESATRLGEAATSMNQMNATVGDVAKNAATASNISNDTKNKAKEGAGIVRKAIESIDGVRNVSMQLKSDMTTLNEDVQSISRIMNVISDIADQTNLLALNAAIEAARAGDAGRGFAVVADEVRKLAEKTMNSTKDVSNAISKIQDSASKSIAVMEETTAGVEEATDLARESGTALEEIATLVETSNDRVHAIAIASEEQSASSEEINRFITELSDMSLGTAEAMKKASGEVKDLASQSHNLTKVISEMKAG